MSYQIDTNLTAMRVCRVIRLTTPFPLYLDQVSSPQDALPLSEPKCPHGPIIVTVFEAQHRSNLPQFGLYNPSFKFYLAWRQFALSVKLVA